MVQRSKTSISISAQANEIWVLLSKYYGISKTSVIELLVREEARELGLVEDQGPLLPEPSPDLLQDE